MGELDNPRWQWELVRDPPGEKAKAVAAAVAASAKALPGKDIRGL